MRLHNRSKLTDISPLADCKKLQTVTLPPNATNVECLRTLRSLERISFVEDQTSYQPDKTVAEFWRGYDTKKKAVNQHP
ncbi:MAG TPA: hypothetical protein VH619_12755 [Verrucomicrobiae bacterium]|nr:hypothetical protein [Verrucomicrobiae bacterium]